MFLAVGSLVCSSPTFTPYPFLTPKGWDAEGKVVNGEQTRPNGVRIEGKRRD